MISVRILATFLSYFLARLYHELAWGYDVVAWLVSLGAWNHWTHIALSYIGGESVLELGPGPGHVQAKLAASGRPIFGLDESPQMLSRSRRLLRSRGALPGLVRGLAQRLPFADGSFDSIISTFPSSYVLDGRTLAEAWRTLRPGGLLVIVPWAFRAETRWLFQITREGPSPATEVLPSALTNMGFEVETRIERSRGVVAVILARKVPQL